MTAPPELGRDTGGVLSDMLGYDAGKLETLRRSNAIN